MLPGYMFKGRSLLIATKHEKEQIIGPIFEKELGVKSILMGFGLDSDAIHSPNEHYGLFNFFKGIETIPRFYHHYIALLRQQ